jgi:heat shock protein HslJ
MFSAACLGSDLADSLGGSWQLTTGTVDGEEIPALSSHPITITFDGEDVGGSASCNSYGGTFELSGSAITFGNMAFTEMACMPEETMTAESMFLEALTRVDTVILDDGLSLAGQGVDMQFDYLPPIPETDLTNTVWVLDGLVTSDAVSSVSGERATLELFTDGSVLGSTGCRLITGQYVVRGVEVVMTSMSAEGDCDPDLARQDDHVLTVLGDGFRAEIEGNRLSLWSMGDEGLTYVADE